MNLPAIPPSIYERAIYAYSYADPEIGSHRARMDAALDAVWPDLHAFAVASLPAVAPWKPVDPGTVIKAGTRYRTTYNGGALLAAERVAAKDFAAGEDYSIDPRTAPDPDADLVEAIGAVLTHMEGGKWGPESVAILAAIRETHTVEPKPTTGPLGGAR